MGIFTLNQLTYDAYGKAKSIRMFSFAAPHMRSFHLSWMGFCIAFFGWYAYSSLLTKTIKPDLGMSATDVANSNTSNVVAVVVFRILIGPLVDKFGPARTMALVLVIGSIPLALSVLSTTATGIIVSRLFISFLGAAFVPCQYWTTAFFSSEIVGTANAIAGGWGNAGAGLTNLIMPRIFNLFYYDAGLSRSVSWRITVGVIPIVLIWCVAFMCYWWGVDSPGDEFKSGGPETAVAGGKDVAGGVAHSGTATDSAVLMLAKTIVIPAVPILMLNYACSFGVELSLDGAIGDYFINTFGVDQSTGSLFSGLFGLMNIFTRFTGGFVSDIVARKHGHGGRIYWHLLLFSISTVSLIVFSFLPDISSSLVFLIIFSFSVEASCGSTFAMVPFAGPYMGSTSGLVGAGGNVGGALFNVLLSQFVSNTRRGFFWMGVCVGIGGFLSTFFLVVDHQYIMKPLFAKKDKELARETSEVTLTQL